MTEKLRQKIEAERSKRGPMSFHVYSEAFTAACDLHRELREAARKSMCGCRRAGMYGPLNIRPGECTCSQCRLEQALEDIGALSEEDK